MIYCQAINLHQLKHTFWSGFCNWTETKILLRDQVWTLYPFHSTKLFTKFGKYMHAAENPFLSMR